MCSVHFFLFHIRLPYSWLYFHSFLFHFIHFTVFRYSEAAAAAYNTDAHYWYLVLAKQHDTWSTSGSTCSMYI